MTDKRTRSTEPETLRADNAALRALADAVGVWREARRRCDEWVKSDAYDPSNDAYFDAVDKAEDGIDAAHDALPRGLVQTGQKTWTTRIVETRHVKNVVPTGFVQRNSGSDE